MARELIKIQSADGTAIKTIAREEYALYAQGGWKEYKEPKKTDYTTSSGNSYSTTIK